MASFFDDAVSFGAKIAMYVIFMAVLLAIVRLLQRVFPQAALRQSNALHRLINLCVNKREVVTADDEASKAPTGAEAREPEETRFKKGLILAGCALGLQTSYLSWGLLQEALMTREYDGVRFTSSQWLVFGNRLLAFFVALVILRFVKQPPFTAPVYQFCYSSFSNVMSSFCQYEVSAAKTKHEPVARCRALFVARCLDAAHTRANSNEDEKTYIR
jgi:hypothetical protein